MPKQRTFWKIAVITLPVLLGAYLASPFVALGSLTLALASGNQEQLERTVNFPSVRAGLKDDLKAQLNKHAADKDNPLGQLGAAFGMALIDPLVEACVTPAGIASLVQNAKVKAPPPKTGNPSPPSSHKQPKLRRCWFTALNEFQVEYDNGVKLRLQLCGWRWKLTRVSLPA